MEENAFPEQSGGIKAKLSHASSRLFSIVKLLLGLLLLLFVYSSTVSFLNEYAAVPAKVRNWFFIGIVSFLVLHHFIWEPAVVYAKGQKILQKVFSFFAPLVKVAPYLLPVYTLLLFGCYAVYSVFDKGLEPLKYFMLLFGVTMGLHLVFSAKSLRSRQGDFLKANYIFGFSFIYVLNVSILALGFSLLFDKFSFVNFCNHSFKLAGDILHAVWKQLFV